MCFRKICISIAILDEILSPDWESRHHSFDPKWGEGLLMASMRNGSGDDWFMGFAAAGVFMKGFAHESKMSPFAHEPPKLWPGMYDGVPNASLGFRNEPAFEPDAATYCFWWERAQPGWRTGVKEFPRGDDPDGSREQLAILGGDPETYREFAAEYYEREVPKGAIEAIYAHERITTKLVAQLNDEADAKIVIASAKAAGYGSDWELWAAS